MNQRVRRILFCVAAVLASQESTFADSYLFDTFEVPGGYNTQGYGINNLNDVVGRYSDPMDDPDKGFAHGFIYDANGFTKIESVDGNNYVEVDGINDYGVSVVSTSNQGYIRSAAGDFTRIEIDSATAIHVSGINNSGVVVGSYQDLLGYERGFIRSADGTITTVDALPPDVDGHSTWLTGVNNLGETVGYYIEPNGTYGFIRSSDGSITSYSAIPGYGATFSGINDLGEIIGYTGDPNRGLFTYVLSADLATVTPIINPLASLTWANAINNSGVITGYYYDALGDPGFLATPIPASVPEPASLASLAVGTIGLGIVRLRRKALL